MTPKRLLLAIGLLVLGSITLAVIASGSRNSDRSAKTGSNQQTRPAAALSPGSGESPVASPPSGALGTPPRSSPSAQRPAGQVAIPPSSAADDPQEQDRALWKKIQRPLDAWPAIQKLPYSENGVTIDISGGSVSTRVEITISYSGSRKSADKALARLMQSTRDRAGHYKLVYSKR